MSESTTGIPALRAQVQQGKTELLAHFMQARATAPAAARLIRNLTKHIDRALLSLWNLQAMPEAAALLAVGGYGRGELLPYSDVDVLVLLPPAGHEDDVQNARTKVALEAFITSCWDIGLEIGSSVRTL
ncbi:MAG: nucleotidyltransferase domain-containing protein, partial [Burkholderiaceae bacterium]